MMQTQALQQRLLQSVAIQETREDDIAENEPKTRDAALSMLPQSDTSKADTTMRTKCSQKPRQRRRTCERDTIVKLSMVFFTNVYSVAVTRGLAGWKVQIWMCNQVSPDAYIFECYREGNLGEVRRLIQSGLASPLDTSLPRGWGWKGTQTVFEVGITTPLTAGR
jgi:hypothetical protein